MANLFSSAFQIKIHIYIYYVIMMFKGKKKIVDQKIINENYLKFFYQDLKNMSKHICRYYTVLIIVALTVESYKKTM